MKKILFLYFILIPFLLNAQIIDDFSDGDITSSPTWEGNLTSYHIGDPITSGDGAINSDAGNDAFVLSSNVTTGDAIVTTASNIAYGEWIFSVADGRNWSVSSTNDYKIILISDDNTVGNLADGASMNFNGYFLRFDGGQSDQFILYKQTGTTSDIIIDTDFPTTTDGDTPIGRTIKVTRALNGDWSIFIDEGFEITPTTQRGITVNDNTHTTSSYFGVATNIVNPGTARVLYFDNLQITALPTNNQTSTISAGATTEPTSISSLNDTQAEATFVFDFNFVDQASGDGLATIIDQIKVTQGTNNQVSNWTDAIAGASLSGTDITGELVGTINATDITFAGDDFVSIADGANETYELKIWLKTNLSNISDNDNLDFKLSYTDINCDASGSSFGSGDVESGAETIEIDATKINFKTIPANVTISSDFTVIVAATDINNNVDTDETSSVSLSKASGTGTLSSSSGLVKTMTLGEATWSDLQYDTEETFTISASSGGFTTISSGAIQCQSSITYLNDDFEDNDIAGWQESTTGRWESSIDNPINGSYSLKQIFNNSASDVDIIAHPINSVDLSSGTKAWRFQLRYENPTPSGNNNWSVFLMADSDETEMFPGGNINGYLLGINFSGNDDIVKLSKITNGAETVIINTTYDWNTINTSEASGFEVLRQTDGTWEVKIDDNGGFDNLQSYGTANDLTHTSANYFGIYYKYSSTLDRKLWIDDVYFGAEIPDLEAPLVNSLEVISPNSLQITFNENLDQISAETLTNYSVNNTIGNPNVASLDAGNHKIINLQFANQFVNGQQNEITINNVEDESGNAIATTNVLFTWKNIDAVSASATTDSTLDILFTKELNISTATSLTNYLVDNLIGNPETANIDASNNKLVHLKFANKFTQEQSYSINVSNVEDIYSNVMLSKDISFTYYKANPYDIVINEIMFDVNPTPPALPVFEYIEIYNNSDYAINLSAWTLEIGGNLHEFPDSIISANGYAIICEEGAVSSFSDLGMPIGIMDISELTITGKRLIIRDNDNNIIEDITYLEDWHTDSEHDSGGFSIERIDPTNLCGEEENWATTANIPMGGTPGSLNSVFATNPDNSKPTVLSVDYISSKELRIIFSEKVEIGTSENVANYTLNGTINPTSATVSFATTAELNLVFADNFSIGENTLLINNIADNCGNIIDDYTYTFEYQLLYPKSVEVISENQLKLHFSEKVELTSAQMQANYSVDKGIGVPTVALINNFDSTIVSLLFDNTFTLEETYNLTVENVKDINGNIMNSENINFIYYIAKPYDIVINEIMCDINPVPIAVPEARYVELYNTSNFDIDLTDWNFISEGQLARGIPYVTLKSNEYLILCEEDDASLFAGYENVLPILGSSDIIASGRNLKLISSNNTIIEEVDYTAEWYNDEDKDNGGWSIERIDPNNYCGEINNWKACENNYGGTPGSINSVNASNVDNSAPDLLDLKIISSNYLMLTFSENISYESGNDTLNYSVNNGITYPHEAIVDSENRTIVHLKFNNQFVDELENTLSIENIKDNCDNTMPAIEYNFTYELIKPLDLWVKDEKHLKIKFSESVDLVSGTNLSNFFASNGIGNPKYIARETADTTVVYLEFLNDFPSGEELTLSISGVKDINGNIMEDADLLFSYYIPQKNDIAINEVLFYPNTGGSDFVELYNRSEKRIDLLNIQLATWDDELDTIKSVTPLSETNLYFEPATYLAFTQSKEGVLTYYMSKNQENILELESFPSYPSDEGKVVLLYKDTTIIDEFDYFAGMHFKLLDSEKGVSLERVNYDKPSQEISNWHSASEYVGFATPAYKNSQYSEGVDPGDKPVVVEPYMFSPNNDGIEDYANINYKFQNPGHVATVIIFDAKGRQVKQLANNLLLSIEGTISWDGLYENGRLAPAGTYLIYFSVYDLDGNINKYKIPVVSARKF